jgi:hypothetical protein
LSNIGKGKTPGSGQSRHVTFGDYPDAAIISGKREKNARGRRVILSITLRISTLPRSGSRDGNTIFCNADSATQDALSS